MSAFDPAAVPDQSASVPPWADTPLEVLCNGPFWVFVFFVLSGYVLGHASRERRTHFWLDVAARYLRLALPATASVLLAWAALTLFPLATAALNDVAPSPWFRWVVQGQIPSLYAAAKDGMYGIFRNGGSYFNNVLWTMRIELIGSWGVYAFFQLCRERRRLAGTIIVVALLVAPAPSGYVAFALGAMLSTVDAAALHRSGLAASLLFATGLVLGSQARGWADRHGFGGWPAALRPGDATGLAYPLGALAVVAGVLGSRPLQRFFESRLCQGLGRLSFPLYLVHVPLLYTLVAAAVLRLQPLTAATLGLVGIGFLAASLALAWMFEVGIDRPVLAFNRRIARRSRAQRTNEV